MPIPLHDPVPAARPEAYAGWRSPADCPVTLDPGPRVAFPLLADPAGYRRCDWALERDDAKRLYWLGVFREHYPKLEAQAVLVAQRRGRDGDAWRERLAEARAWFLDRLRRWERPEPGETLDVLAICEARERALRYAGVDDAYLIAKERENEAALALLPAWLGDVDATPEAQRLQRLIEGVFAGNIFDLGATALADRIAREGVDFHATLARLPRRPWRIDHLDELSRRWHAERPYRSACLFVDNAGCDVVLGMIPLARELLRRGASVLLTANSTPSLNDVTHGELVALIQRIAAWDRVLGEALASDRLALVPSGNGLPLIDLGSVSVELAQAVVKRGVDLVVLEGMGRGVESNHTARLSCDAVKIAMIKDAGVARALEAALYDVVLRFDPGA